jgi:hypothetical protein
MNVIEEKSLGYSRFVVLIGDIEKAEVFVFYVDHSKIERPYILIENFNILNETNSSESVKYGKMLIRDIFAAESEKNESLQITSIKFGESFQRVGEVTKIIGDINFSPKRRINMNESYIWDE